MDEEPGSSLDPAALQDARYVEWQARPWGAASREALTNLTRRMTSGWPRRGRNLLEMFCADGYFLEMFWHSGFDVTGQDQSPNLLGMARSRLKNTADFVLSHPEGLPYDDRSFDYVVCLVGIEAVENTSGLINEMFRLATRGVLLAFPSYWSLHGLGCLIGRRCAGEKFFSPARISSMMRRADNTGTGKASWASSLHGPAWTWAMPRLTGFNYAACPLPLGAINMVRVDFNPPLGSNSILVTGKRALRRQTASSGVGRVTRFGAPAQTPQGIEPPDQK